MNLAFFQSPVSGDTGTKCADVVISPSSGDLPLTISLTTTQTSGHIFYRIAGATPIAPVHNGDNAVSPTIRIGGNAGTVTIKSGVPNSVKTISAVCVEPGFLDSNVSIGTYDSPDTGL